MKAAAGTEARRRVVQVPMTDSQPTWSKVENGANCFHESIGDSNSLGGPEFFEQTPAILLACFKMSHLREPRSCLLLHRVHDRSS